MTALDKFEVGKQRIAEFDAMPQRELAYKMLEDFRLYVEWIHLQAYGCPFIFEEVHYTIIDALQKFAEGKFPTRNLAINVFPGVGKTTLVQYWISWCFARCRSAMFLYINAVEAIVKELSANTRDLLLLPAWQRLYGVEIDNTKLSGAQTSKTRWSLKNGGLNSGLIAKTTYSSLLGLNAGNPNADGFPGGLMLDDPQGSTIITQEHERQQTQALYKRDMESRRRGTQIGTILVQQRLHIDDLTGFLKRTEPSLWTFISVPALIRDEDGKYRSTCPRVKSVEELLEMRERNPYDFYSLYQQEPVVWGGAIYKEEWFKYYEHLPKINHFILAADTAVKDGEHNDYSVVQLWGRGADGNAYLIDHIRGKWKTPDLRKQCVAFYGKCLENYPALRRFWIEDKASGMGLIQEINNDARDAGLPRLSVMPFKKGARQNKAIMNNDAANYFEESRVYFPKFAPWLSEVVGELLSFDPANKHATDDICFVAGTKVLTTRGYKNIEEIKIGDKIITPLGNGVVKNTSVRKANVITNIGLTGTPNHKVYNKETNTFDKLKNMTYKRCSVYGIKEQIRWKYLRLLNLMGNNTPWLVRDDITSKEIPNIQNEKILKDFIRRFGNFIQEKQFLRGMSFITKMAIISTTTLITWSVLQSKNIMKFIKPTKWLGETVKKIKTILNKLEKWLANGISQNQEDCGTKNTQKFLIKPEKSQLVLTAGKNTQPSKQGKPNDAETVKHAGKENKIQNIIEKSTDEVGKRNVYNITVDKGMYYANGILVSNCDTVAMACKILLANKSNAFANL